jgi:opacity protein-like surface antigen
MSHFKRASAILLTAMSAASPVLAHPFEWHPHAPYLGADLQERQMQYKRGFGDNLLKTTAIQGNLYTGVKLKENLNLEFGYEVTKTKSRLATLQTGDLAAGTLIASNASPVVFRSSATVKGPHLDLVGFRGVDKNPDFKFFASVGVAVFRVGFQRETLHYGSNAQPGNVRVLSKNKPVLRLATGIEYSLHENISTRLSIGWSNTSNVVAKSSDGQAVKLQFKHEDTTFCGLGLLWKF